MTARDGSADLVLAIDTALVRAVVALGRSDGSLVDQEGWVAGHRHGEELLRRVEALLARNGVALSELRGVVTGTGPGAFTGLRVGIATSKALAHGLGLPLVGVSTAAALLDAAAAADGAGGAASPRDAVARAALLLPAGPSDRVLVLDGEARLLPFGSEPDATLVGSLVAVDLPDRAPDRALTRGQHAVQGLAASLVRLGAARLAAGEADDVARLVPEYVTLPRGVTKAQGEVEWSHGRR